MLKCIELDERLKAMDQEITVNPQFVQKVIGVPSLTEVCWRELGGVPVCNSEVHGDVLVESVSTLQAGRVFRGGGGGPRTASLLQGVISSGAAGGKLLPRQTSALSPASLPEHGVTGR